MFEHKGYDGKVDLNEAFDDVVDWNFKCGNGDKVTFQDALNQSKFVLEEAKETIEALQASVMLLDGKLTKEHLKQLGKEYKPFNEVVDGVMDLFVTANWLLYQIGELGYDTLEAWNKVMNNNYQKVLSGDNALKELDDAIKKYNQPLELKESVFENESYYTIRDENNKLRKPVDFNEVDLDDCVPEDLGDLFYGG